MRTLLKILVVVALIVSTFSQDRPSFRKLRYKGAAKEEGRDNDSDYTPWTDTIQITGHIRDYVSGPVDGQLMLTEHDTVEVYAGAFLPVPGNKTHPTLAIRRWALYRDYPPKNSFCTLHTVYDFGKRAVFLCWGPGTYMVYASDRILNRKNFTAEIEKGNLKLELDGTSDKPVVIFSGKESTRLFDLSDGANENVGIKKEWKKYLKNANFSYVQSDPIEIVGSQYCYYWNYQLREVSRVGFFFREADAVGSPQKGSYILMRMEIWIMEPTGVGESERESYKSTTPSVIIPSYSKILTKKFHAKGLFPCLRYVHPSVEISSEIIFLERSDALESPHWRVELKIHTDTIISTLSDVGWTISSRQHIALFHCFVGEVRVFVDIQNFEFIRQGVSDQSEIAWNNTVLPKTMSDYLKLKMQYVFGHPTAYIGPIQSRNYQPSQMRTDLVVINNPCVAQEFAIAAAGQIQIVEEFMIDYSKNSHAVILPGFESLDADAGTLNGSDPTQDRIELNRRHQEYLKIADAAITPTHAAFLMEDSSIYLHSRSAYYKGLAYLRLSKKDRLSALVKRRWCARSGTPKTNNMMIPAFSPLGNILIIQVYPVEGTTPMWINDPIPNCLGKNEAFFNKTGEQVRQTINESCIHQGEAVVRSDERGLPLVPKFSDCESSLLINATYLRNVNPASLKTYLSNQGLIYSEVDPHFAQDLTNVAIHKTGNKLENHNKAFTLHVDSNEEEPRIPKILTENGLNLIRENILIHSVDFTPDENTFLVGVQLFSSEFANSTPNATVDDDGYAGLETLFITTLFLRNMPSQLFPEAVEIEEVLDVGISFPGLIIMRKKLHSITNKFDLKYINLKSKYVMKLFPLNTAIPSFVIDLGNVFIYSTVDSKYARPLTFFARDDIHERLAAKKAGKRKNNYLKKSQKKPVFSKATTKDATLFDIIVTEQGTLSILKRRRMRNIDIYGETQTVFIGSVVTLDSLREVAPFVSTDKIFQMGTPDGEIVYGKFTTEYIYPACNPDWKPFNYTNATTTCLIQPTAFNNLPENVKKHNAYPFCVSTTQPKDPCTGWMYFHDKKLESFKFRDTTDGWTHGIGRCRPGTLPDAVACMIVVNKTLTGSKLPPDSSPITELRSAEILSIPYHSLLNGNLQLLDEEKLTETGPVSVTPSANRFDRKLCPFIAFRVTYVKFNFAEVGFKTRITAAISYQGKEHLSEAELIIEYENIPGIQVEINSAEEHSFDQTSLTKTIDITFRLSNINLQRMKNQKLRTYARERRNLAKEKIAIFGLTIRPAIINLKCRKEEFFINLHFATGCNPFNKMRFISESSPVKRHIVRKPGDDGYNDKTGFKRDGNFLVVNRDEVWHRQREKFGCQEEGNQCKIPQAYLYEENVFDISWRDPFVPKFEQFLRTHSRKVTANVVLYDLFGFDVVMNISNLDAGCFNTAGSWYNTLLNSTKSIDLDTSDQEDIYSYYVDCFDHSIMPRDPPKVLSFSEYRLSNTTNYNRIRFDVADASHNFRRTKNRNQFLLFRAVVVNTDFNRFTYCQLMDTFFLVRIVGMQAPRKGLDTLTYVCIILGLIIFLIIVYLIFAYCYTWKLDVAQLDTNPDEELLDPDTDEVEDRRFARDVREQRRWKTAYTKIQALAAFKEAQKAEAGPSKNKGKEKSKPKHKKQ